MKKYDVAIIGAGTAGVFAALRINQFENCKAIVFDIGRPFAKRRRFLEGALGCFPNSDGKLYPGNIDSIKNTVDGRTVNAHYKWINSILEKVGSLKLTKDAKISADLIKRIEAAKFSITKNDYFQWKPDPIHKLSKYVVSEFDKNDNITFSFDNEVHQILKKKDFFQISTNNGDFQSKKIIFCPGRTGWRWATKFYKEMGMEVKDDYAHFGIRFEISAQYLKELNKSHSTLVRSDYEVGPFSWNGTIMPEDHADLVCSTFRSNEERWHSEKVSFALIGNRYEPDNGVAQTERLANLAYLLFNDRVTKEKIRVFLKNSSQLNLIPEYAWLEQAILELDGLFPNLINKGCYYVPTIQATPGKINLDSDLCSEIPGFYVAGEAAAIPGILGAAVSGSIVANNACK